MILRKVFSGDSAGRFRGPILRRVVVSGLALVIMSVCFFSCGGLEDRARLEPPEGKAESLIGLALAEKIHLNFKRRAMTGLTPLRNSVSWYHALLKPGDLDLTFESRGSSGLYLAWIPADRLPAGTIRVTIIPAGHEIDSRAGNFKTTWSEDQALAVSGLVKPGRVTYLGLIERRIFIPETGRPEAAEDPDKPWPRVELSFSPDPEGRAILGLCLDNPWLKERLLNPPGSKIRALSLPESRGP
ncbi:MAG: hypothetical protein SV487_12950 [Thermodesulfobacteriota bacterium]|nr:hypothetical protein [Thermodesulfobacteriota bacterium]